MTPTLPTLHLNPIHPKRPIPRLLHILRLPPIKRRPPAGTIEFLCAVEEEGVATYAAVLPGLGESPKAVREGGFGATLTGDVVLLGCQLGSPFSFCLFDGPL